MDENNQPNQGEDDNHGTSLEASGSGQSLEQNSAAGAPPPKPPKRGLRGRLAGLNIYLLLFIFLLIIAAAAVIIITTKGSSPKKPATINGKNLSQTELKHLAQNSVAVGNPDQVLKISSNAIFGQQVLIQKDLDVAGSLKVGGSLKLNNVSVSGAGSFGSLTTGGLSDSGSANVRGSLTLGGSLNVAGATKLGGSVAINQLSVGNLTLNNDLQLTHHIQAGGSTPGHSLGNALGAGGTASLSGSDTAGAININTGGAPHAGCFINVRFASSFHGAPYLVVTPVGSAAGGLQFYVNRSTRGFSVCSANAAPAGRSFGFDYIALD
ncbi:MAG: hypothetical protein ACREGA_04700 [Candidatus Saccharimonadales bacterium]